MKGGKGNIALLMLEISDLRGGGGAERFFADFFEIYNDQENPHFRLYLITDSIKNFLAVNKLTGKKNILLVRNYRYEKYFKNKTLQKLAADTIGEFLLWFGILKQVLKNNISVLHIPLYEKRDFYLIKGIDLLFGKLRPRIVINIVDSVIPYYYFNKESRHAASSKSHYGKLFGNVNIDAVFSWYLLFKEFATGNKIIKSNPPITVINSRFTAAEINEDFGKKENLVTFSARLNQYKKPVFFIEAVNIIKSKMDLADWKFEIYGKGPMEGEVTDAICKYGLEKILSLTHHAQMPLVFERSKIFVSTQDFENFPSLSMAEAMAKGNAIVSRNVGQTHYYVKNNINGFLLNEDSPADLAEKLMFLITSPGRIESMGKESISIIKNVHNKENFIRQIDTFWSSVI